MSQPAPPRRPARWVALAVVTVAAVAATAFAAGGLPEREPAADRAPAKAAGSTPTAAPEPSEPPQAPEPPEPRHRDRGRKVKNVPQQPVDAAGRALADRVEELLELEDVQPARFRVASYNVLGASHTSAGGNKPQFASGTARMVAVVQQLAALDIDVVGFQEYEPSQHSAFVRLTAGRFGVFPGQAKGRNSIAWRKDAWRLVSADTIAVPYFRGKPATMPYVLLEHVETGRAVYFLNVHNPASSRRRGDNERWRDVATARQATLANRLRQRTGFPVILTGDFNEREEAFCAVTAQTGMRAANGGSNEGACRPPADPRIDWIFGSEDVAFSGFQRLASGSASDHPLILADAEAD